MSIPVLLFDGDCAFCSSSARVLKKMTKGNVEILPYQLQNLEKFGVTASACEQAVQFVSVDKISSGHIAIADALLASRSLWWLAGVLIKLPVVTSLAYLIYEWVSKNRHRLPGGTPACQIKNEGK